MITRLLPHQVAEQWSIIKHGLSQALPPGIPLTEETLTNILEACVTDQCQVWYAHESDFEEKRSNILAVGITVIIEELLSKEKTLLIYALYGSIGRNGKLWYEGLEALKKYAKSRDCRNITAYSNIQQAIALAKNLGGKIDTRYIILEV